MNDGPTDVFVNLHGEPVDAEVEIESAETSTGPVTIAAYSQGEAVRSEIVESGRAVVFRMSVPAGGGRVRITAAPNGEPAAGSVGCRYRVSSTDG
jgi:hypothetical protein